MSESASARASGRVRPSAMVSPSLAGALNRGRVLKTLYANGPLPRPELARLTGSTRATIGQIVQPLLDEGLLEERAPIASGAQGGKPARPVWFAGDGWPVGAVLLLPIGAQAALVTAGGTIVASRSIRFRPRRADHAAIVEQLIQALRELAAEAASPMHGVGIAVGGMVDTQTGDVVQFDLAPGFNGMAIGRTVAGALGVPTFVDNQPRAQVLGDLFFGAGRGEESFASVYVGEGIGAGYILDGALHRGARGAGGEVGHTTVDLHGPVCRCGRRGCWEAVASMRWLRAEATVRDLPAPRTIGAARLVRLARTGPAARDLLQEYGTNVAVGLANLQQTLGLSLFVVHGDPVAGGEEFRELIEKHLRERAFAHPGVRPRVRFAAPDDDITMRGTAALVLSRLLHVAF